MELEEVEIRKKTKNLIYKQSIYIIKGETDSRAFNDKLSTFLSKDEKNVSVGS